MAEASRLLHPRRFTTLFCRNGKRSQSDSECERIFFTGERTP